MTFTPSFKGAAIAGVCLWTLAWTSLLHLDKIPYLRQRVDKEAMLRRINQNKFLTLLCTEVFNFGIHGVSRPDSTMFAVGGSVVNFFMVLFFIPWRMRRKRRQHGDELLTLRPAAKAKSKGAGQ